MPLTNGSTCAPLAAPRSETTASTITSATCAAVPSASRRRPGSPWMPMPISISPAGRSKIGLPAAGGVHDDSATPNERARSLTWRGVAPTAATPPPPPAGAPATSPLARRPGDLLRQHGGTHAAAPRRVERVLHGDVVVDQHGLDLDPL